MRALLSSLLLSLSLSAFSVSEKEFDGLYESAIMPHFHTMLRGEFKNQQRLTIQWRGMIKPTATKTLVIFPGRTEASLKYAELIYDLNSEDLNVFILDHQGQGESGRLFRRADKCHVRKFSHYVQDAETFMKKVVIPNSKGTERYLLGHSMGGLISVHYVKRNPTHFKKVVLSAPMLQINTYGIGEWKSYLAAKALWLIGKGSNYLPKGRPWNADLDLFDRSFTTTSQVRFDAAKNLWLKEPTLQVGDPTVSWTMQSILWGRYTPPFAHEIKTPILILRAGNDRVVKGGRMETFCKRAKNCQLHTIAGAEHGLFDEKDVYRDEVIEKMRGYLKI